MQLACDRREPRILLQLNYTVKKTRVRIVMQVPLEKVEKGVCAFPYANNNIVNQSWTIKYVFNKRLRKVVILIFREGFSISNSKSVNQQQVANSWILSDCSNLNDMLLGTLVIIIIVGINEDFFI